ncbi:MAG: DUF1624 domain-containing protein [Deltaproteobacteria bacterium]|nr:MAG: DUF1624 domain-containing protein [Deltaproteobacteria bacterium]
MTTNPTSSSRWVALDWARGWVMVLMALDHASVFFNPGRVSSDSVVFYKNTALPLGQFMLRWVTHLCAPSFLFLAGAGIALSVARREARGEPVGLIDRHLMIRGLILIGIDLTYLSSFAQVPFLQVLFAIGSCLLLMIPLRRLPLHALIGLALGWMVLGELITSLFWDPTQGHCPAFLAPLFGFYKGPWLFVLYPTLHWLPAMLLGWCLGLVLPRWSQSGLRQIKWRLLGFGLLLLLVFAVVRGWNGYGNFSLFRLDHSLAQWLHVNKYPPSLSFLSLELGLLAILLFGCLWRQERGEARTNGPLLVWGQTALFFYVLHFALLFGLKKLVGSLLPPGVLSTFLVAGTVLLLLYPLCRWYRSYKQAHPTSWVRFV